MKRIFLIVLDSVGIGAEPDAPEYGDAGTNTLKSASTSSFSTCLIWKSWDSLI